jgi:hypothetical protein
MSRCGEEVEDVDVSSDACRLFTVELGEELLVLALFGDGGGESGLYALPPRLVDVRVTGRVQLLEFLDQVLLTSLEVVQHRGQLRAAGLPARLRGVICSGGGCGCEVGLAAGAEDASVEEPGQRVEELVLGHQRRARVSGKPGQVAVVRRVG